MLRYVIRRLLYAFPTLVGVSVAVFLLFYVVSPPELIARKHISAKNPTKQQIQDWMREHGYDKPLWQQATKHISELTLYRFGVSDSTGEDIWGRIRKGIGPTLMLASLVLVAAIITDIFLALFVAYFRGTYVDLWGVFLCVLLMSISYLVYLITGQYLLGKVLKYWPLAGYQPGVASIKFVMMPMVVGVVSGLGAGVRLYRTFVLDELNQDYVRTARAKGVSEQTVLFAHVLKNAAIPILTTIVMQIPLMLLGSLLLESFFSIPGLGGYTVDAITGGDFAVVRAMVYLGATLYIIGTILTDISYALVDPRVRLE